MKSLQFESIFLRSRRDRRGTQIEFHPKRNLVVGHNHTGKSSLIKAIFGALGARPEGSLLQWDAETETLLRIRVDGQEYEILRHSGFRALFRNKKLVALSRTHAEWTEIFGNLMGFNLTLNGKDSNVVAADPRCFFLPFYINQDGSWGGNWDTFVGLKQYKQPQSAILDYFSGVKPPAYYDARSAKSELERKLSELTRELGFLERARTRLANTFPLDGPRTTPEGFDLDLERLTSVVSDLNEKQERIRGRVMRERELVDSIVLQRESARRALDTYRRDSEYLQDQRERLICPTCNAEHTEPFIDLLGYAEDARVLSELVLQLEKDFSIASSSYRSSRAELTTVATEYEKVASILEIKKGDLRLGDVLQGMGAEAADKAFEAEAKPLKGLVSDEREKIEALEAKMDELTDLERSKSILSAFRSTFAAALFSLNVPLGVGSARLTTRPKMSGSGGPRAVLGYYSAIWSVCRGEHGSFDVPLVIDAPNQHGQDENNLPRVLRFLAKDTPDDAQIIVGAEIDGGHKFDKHIELKTPYELLSRDEFEDVSEVLDPYINAMYGQLRDEDDDPNEN